MKNILVFAGSNSKKSINKELAMYASGLLNNVSSTILDLNDFLLPLYGLDEEAENGIPENSQKFLESIKNSDGIILSLAEHNGNFSVAFKNIFDWMSRIEPKLWNNKPMLLMATSPGARGGASVLSIAKNGFPHMGGNIVSDFSLPSFYDNFKQESIVNEDLKIQLVRAVSILEKEL
jgi:NAD(P)H-dependent FMN reductase